MSYETTTNHSMASLYRPRDHALGGAPLEGTLTEPAAGSTVPAPESTIVFDAEAGTTATTEVEMFDEANVEAKAPSPSPKKKAAKRGPAAAKSAAKASAVGRRIRRTAKGATTELPAYLARLVAAHAGPIAAAIAGAVRETIARELKAKLARRGRRK